MAKRGTFGPAVDPRTRVLRYTSASAVGNFDPSQYGGCNRRWFYDKVMGYKQPESKAQEVGKVTHDQVDHYLTTGEDVLGHVARQGRHFIPRPGLDLLVEWPFVGERPRSDDEPDPHERLVRLFDTWREWCVWVDRESGDGAAVEMAQAWYRDNVPYGALVSHAVPWVGFMDLVHRRDHWVDTDGVMQHMPPDTAEVCDWKTSSDIRKYAKRGVDLLDTVQMVTYAAWAVRRWPDLQHVRLSHGYLATRSSEVAADKRSATISLASIQSKWQRIEDQVLAMGQVAREDDVSRVEANYASCTAYGGCYYATVCPRSPARVLVDLLGSRAVMVNNGAGGSAGGSAGVDPAAIAAARENLLAVEAAAKGVTAQTTFQAVRDVVCVTCGERLEADNAQQAQDGAVWHMRFSQPMANQGALRHMLPHPGATLGAVLTLAGHGGAEGAKPAPARMHVVWTVPVTVLRHRQQNYGVVVRVPPDGAYDGAWYFRNVNADLSLAEPASTRPDQWFADVWEDVTGQVRLVETHGRTWVTFQSPGVPTDVSACASGGSVTVPRGESHPTAVDAVLATAAMQPYVPAEHLVGVPRLDASVAALIDVKTAERVHRMPGSSDDSSPRYFSDIDPPGWMAWNGKVWVPCAEPLDPVLRAPSLGHVSITPPDVPASALPDAADAVPANTALPLAVAEVALRHAAEVAAKASAAGLPGGVSETSVLDAVAALDLHHSGVGAPVNELAARLNVSAASAKKAVDALVASGKLTERKKRPRLVSVAGAVSSAQLEVPGTQGTGHTVEYMTMPPVIVSGVGGDGDGVGVAVLDEGRRVAAVRVSDVSAVAHVTGAVESRSTGKVLGQASPEYLAACGQHAAKCQGCFYEGVHGVMVVPALHTCSRFPTEHTVPVGAGRFDGSSMPPVIVSGTGGMGVVPVAVTPMFTPGHDLAAAGGIAGQWTVVDASGVPVTSADVVGTLSAPADLISLPYGPPAVVPALMLLLDVSVEVPGLVVRDLEPYAAEIHRRVAEAARLPDVRLADKDHALGYGRWKAAIAAAARCDPPTGPCRLVVAGDEIKAEVANALLPFATGGVVRPVR